MTDIIAAKESREVLNYLLKRRSTSIQNIGDPGPSPDQINTMLQVASRVPDHGRLFPWHYMVFEGDARRDIGSIISSAYKAQHKDAPPAKLELEIQRFMRAPVVIAVISRIRKGKHPVWEQILSAGASCQNLCLAANTMGFGANWVTEWYSYNDMVRDELGLDKRDHIAGFIFIGTAQKQPIERDRPDLDKIVTHWKPGELTNKGDDYDREAFGFPETGFDFDKIG